MKKTSAKISAGSSARGFLTAGLALALSLAAQSARADDPRPDFVRIRAISYAGTGCPAGSVAQNVAPDLKAFTLIFDQFVAEVGPGLPLAASRKNCAINLDLAFPSGWSYSILDVDYRGFAELDAGAAAVQQSSYYFQGDVKTASLATTLRGPTTQDYQVRDSLGLEALVWSPCGMERSLNINTQVRASAVSRAARGLITLDSIDGTLTHVYGLRWRRCL